MTVERPVAWVAAAAVVALAWVTPRIPTPTDVAVVWLLVAVVAAPLAVVLARGILSR